MVPLLPAWRAHALTEGGPNFHLTPVSQQTLDTVDEEDSIPTDDDDMILASPVIKIEKTKPKVTIELLQLAYPLILCELSQSLLLMGTFLYLLLTFFISQQSSLTNLHHLNSKHRVRGQPR
jgi:hypothetical protein